MSQIQVFFVFTIIAVTVMQLVDGHGKGHSLVHYTKHDGHPKEVHYHHGHQHYVDYHTHPKYQFEYKVENHHTGDIKSHHEERDGDKVKGFYKLHQPDGHVRDVHYHGDHHTGFHADVKYDIHHIMPKHNH